MFRRRKRADVRLPSLPLGTATSTSTAARRPAAAPAAVSPRRGARRSALVAVLVVLCAPFVVAPAAQSRPVTLPTESMPSASDIVIHKLAQPEEPGDPATGLEQEVPGAAISGVTFSATQVPGIDLTAPSGWADAASLPVSEAIRATEGLAAAATTTTDAAGTGTLTDLPAGLYLVRETAAPAGVLSADPFLVTSPMPHQGRWLATIHVYPKNAVASISLAVEDSPAIDASNPVDWRSSSTIPAVDTLNRYLITNTLDPALRLVGGAAAVRVHVPWGIATADEAQVYLDTMSGADCAPSARTRAPEATCVSIRVEFTAAGLTKLEEARRSDPAASVQVRYQTTVDPAVNARGNGVFRNHAALAAGSPAGGTTTPSASQVTKFGPLVLQARDRDNKAVTLPGVTFQLFASKEDAQNRVNPLTVWGRTEWTTDANGQVLLDGLRFSDFADGLDQPAGGALYRPYLAVVIGAPYGWSYNPQPLTGLVETTEVPAVLTAELWRVGGGTVPGGNGGEGGGGHGGHGGSGGSGGPGLPATGANVVGAAILGLALIWFGVIVARRRRPAADER